MLIQYRVNGRKITTFDKNNENYEMYNTEMKLYAKMMNEMYESCIKGRDIDDVACAYRPGKSVADAVLKHTPNNYFIKMDISDFFNTTVIQPTLPSNIYNYMTGHLGIEYAYQGLAISPAISNYMMIMVDEFLKGLESTFEFCNLKVTRYSDDITVSLKSEHMVERTPDVIIDAITATLNAEGYKVNDKKTKRIDFNKENHCKLLGINIIRGAEGNYIKNKARRKSANSFSEYNHKRYEESDVSN